MEYPNEMKKPDESVEDRRKVPDFRVRTFPDEEME